LTASTGGHSGPVSQSQDSTDKRSVTDDIRSSAERHSREAAATAREATESAKEAAHDFTDKKKRESANELSGIAGALKGASSDLEQRGQGFAAQCVGQAADGLEELSHSLERKNVGELVAGVEDFARRQPIPFLGGAVIADIGLARLMKSSATDHREAQTRPGSQFGDTNRGVSSQPEDVGRSAGSQSGDAPIRGAL